MQTTNLQQLRENADGVVAAAQREDVFVIDEGKVVAVVSKPPSPASPSAIADRPAKRLSKEEFEKYWQERERLLADVIASPGWDSTEAVSEDRDRA